MVEPLSCKSSFRIKGMGTASFLMPREDPKAADIARMLARCVPLVAILRSDGNLPFVGFPTSPSFDDSDPYSLFQLSDHTLLLNQANTRILDENSYASGHFIVDEIRAANNRLEPRLPIDLGLVNSGPPASLAVSGQNLDSFIRELENQTDYEAFFTYNVSPADPYPSSIKTYLNWQHRQGENRRTEDSWYSGKHLGRVKYSFDYTKGIKAYTSVGGTGALTSREKQSVTSSGYTIGNSVIAPPSLSSPSFNGSKVEFIQSLTKPNLLADRSRQYIFSPENAVVKWECDLIESEVDMKRVNVGDIRILGSNTVLLGEAVEGIARLIGLEIDADAGVHKFVAVETV